MLLRPSAGEHGTMFVLARDAGANAMPSVVLAAEHYNMIARMIAAGVPVTLRVKVGSRYLESDTNSYNVIADLPGHRSCAEGRNRYGRRTPGFVAQRAGRDRQRRRRRGVMEAARILKAIGAKPQRTIRFALWSGEEEGLLGSKAYVAQHLEGPAHAAARAKFDVYFNIDPGAGPVYGFYLQGQENVAAIFDAWLEPFQSMGARKNVVDRIGNTDHLSFTAVGLPSSHETEGVDREHIDLPDQHNALVDAVLDVQPNTVVVLTNGSAVAMPWAARVPAILEGWLGGQGGGGAIADVLLGRVNPSGRLSETFPVALADTPAHLDFPGDGDGRSHFTHRLFTGYRSYDARGIEPLFPFGHGLSYTTFEYSGPGVDGLTVALGCATRASAPEPRWSSFTCASARRACAVPTRS